MGRGLSDVQRTILQVALRNREAERRGEASAGADVYAYEILAAHWGWRPVHAPLREGGADSLTAELRTPLEAHYSRDAIGARAYDAAMSSLVRALRRLEERGLVLRHRSEQRPGWSGGVLTRDGEQLARDLRRASSAARR